MTGYGSYGHNAEFNYQEEYISLLERGWIIAVAHVRGGGELGKDWYKDGKELSKKNTFHDFISCAEFLISNKYTNPNILTATSMSAGGLLLGAVSNMRPDLFKCMVIKVPFTNILDTILDKDLPLSLHEYDEWVFSCYLNTDTFRVTQKTPNILTIFILMIRITT